MKINKAKLLVGTLAIASVAATVGSISGTVAWFQYSTRSTVAYRGAAAHCTENLQIRLHQVADNTNGIQDCATAWLQDLDSQAVEGFLKDSKVGRRTAVNALTPVTSGELALGNVATDLYRNPIYQYPTMTSWKKATAIDDYIELPLEFRVVDVNGAATNKLLAKKIYLSDLTIKAKTAGATTDISKAIRVSVKSASYAQTYALEGATDTNQSVTTYGNLDLNNDGVIDKDGNYEWDTRTAIDYGKNTATGATNVAEAQRTSEKGSGANDVKIANDADPYKILGKELGSTVADDAESASTTYFAVTVRIYLEGWTPLDATNFGATGNVTPTLIWDVAKTVAAEFDVGMRFTAEAHDVTRVE